MDISSWNWSAIAVVFATFGGPIAAIQIQKYLERLQDRKRTKMNIYRVLMSTRATRLSEAHVQALNGIELAFYGRSKKDRKVLEAWRAYHHHLNSPFPTDDHAASVAWGERQYDLFIDLLYDMADCLGYGFDRTYIRNSSYAPTAHATVENEVHTIRTAAVELLTGKRRLLVESSVPMTDQEVAEVTEARKLILEWLRGERAVGVSDVETLGRL